ncbi:MAG: zinc ribbon domain-containing protein [Chloroflexi bacterium]|nr:zinc ribbon domain-containing protein [Chloroflexota bacterium]
MDCPHCGSSNVEQAAFCSNCGKALSAQEGAPGEHFFPAGGPFFPAPPAPPPDVILPSTLGQLLSHTLGVYQKTFGPMLRIVTPAQIPFLVASVVNGDTAMLALTLMGLFSLLLASAAVAYAVVQFYLGRKVSASGSYIGALNNGVSLLVNALIFFGVVFGGVMLSLLIVGIPILVFVVVAWFFYVQAVVIEGRGPVEALRRSWELVRGNWWRTFRLGLVFLLLVLAGGFLLSLPGWAVGRANTTLGDLVMTLGGVFVAPIGYIGATLIYLDLRARKEGLTLSRLASELDGAPQGGPPAEGPRRPL